MKSITQQEFEQLIEDVIEGRTDLKQVIRDLHTSYSALNLKITELSDTNPELYERYITKFPYKPKNNRQINPRGIVIAIMKNGITIGKIHSDYGIPRRTIDRKISTLKQEDPELYEIYKTYRTNPDDILNNNKIKELEQEPILREKSAQELKQEEIASILARYEDMITQPNPVSKKRAAALLGLTPGQISEMYKKVTRISKEQEFRNRQKYDVSNNIQISETETTPKERERE